MQQLYGRLPVWISACFDKPELDENVFVHLSHDQLSYDHLSHDHLSHDSLLLRRFGVTVGVVDSFIRWLLPGGVIGAGAGAEDGLPVSTTTGTCSLSTFSGLSCCASAAPRVCNDLTALSTTFIVYWKTSFATFFALSYVFLSTQWKGGGTCSVT